MSLVSIVTTTIALSIIIALRYLMIAAIANRVFWGGKKGQPRGRQLNTQRPLAKTIRHEMRLSVIASPIYAFPAALALEGYKHGYTKLYLDPAAYGWWWLPVSALIYLFVQDTYYYWLHRGLHHRRVFKWAHMGHHISREPSPYASFAFDPLEAALTAWLLPAMTLVIPINLWVALSLLMLMTAAAVFNHAGREIWPVGFLQGMVGRQLITATHHNAHHAQFRQNYGLYLRFWDKLMGTDVSGLSPSVGRRARADEAMTVATEGSEHR
jgi:sterol desaturase/sphingolipid hydroxylase (fatty acid hydroxylase superfamily)